MWSITRNVHLHSENLWQPAEGFIKLKRQPDIGLVYWIWRTSDLNAHGYFYNLKVLVKEVRKYIQTKSKCIPQMFEWFVSSTMGFVNHKISNSNINHYVIRHQNSNFILLCDEPTGSPIWVNTIADIVRVIQTCPRLAYYYYFLSVS